MKMTETYELEEEEIMTLEKACAILDQIEYVYTNNLKLNVPFCFINGEDYIRELYGIIENINRIKNEKD